MLVVLLGPTSYNGKPLEHITREYGVQDYVRVMPRVSHHEALAFLKGADVALLFGQSGNELLASIPAKAYEYIGMKKPVLAIGAGDEVCRVMRQGGCPVWQIPPNDSKKIAAAILIFLKSNYPDDPLPKGRANNNQLLTRAHMARQLERVLINSFPGNTKRQYNRAQK